MNQSLFNLKINGIAEATIWVKNHWPTHVISVVDPSTELNFEHEKHLVVRAHDACRKKSDYTVLFDQTHLDSILEFTQSLKDGDRLLVHCHQGIARSTAVSIGILLQHGFDPASAYDQVRSLRDIMIPNQHIVELLDRHFRLNQTLIKTVAGKQLSKKTTVGSTIQRLNMPK